jgi:hypothetical protein
MPPVPLFADVEEHVGGAGPVGEIAHFADHQDGRMGIGQRVRESRRRETDLSLCGLEGLTTRTLVVAWS